MGLVKLREGSEAECESLNFISNVKDFPVSVC